MLTRRAALIYGIAFLAFGILGFVPGITHMHHGDHKSEGLIVGGPGHGDLLGLFHVNVLHNLVHLLFGVLGLAAARSFGGARGYFRLVAISYALLAILGMIPTMNIYNTFGLVPIHGHDVWLHVLLALPGFYFGFMRPADVEGGARGFDATTPTT